MIFSEYEGKYFALPASRLLPANCFVEGETDYWQADAFGKIIYMDSHSEERYFVNKGFVMEEYVIIVYRTLGNYQEIRKVKTYRELLDKMIVADKEDDMFNSVRLLKELGEFI